jgi:hypothetical protein
MAKLNNWSIVSHRDPYTAPELVRPGLQGIIENSSLFPDGSRIITSRIVGMEDNVVTTLSGHTYELGVVDPDYETAYPNALERLRKVFNDSARVDSESSKASAPS